jgi:PAS domain S-box-containing protein
VNNKEIKILCLEDVEADAVFIREKLKSEGLIFQFDYVSTEAEFTEKLRSVNYDIVLSDYNLPGFSGIAALVLSKKICPDVPFICISGAIGEDLAVELIQLGAADYILKDRLSKLYVAIERALREVNVQKARIEAENDLKESRERYQNLVENINDVIYEIDSRGIITYISPIIKSMTGFPDKHYTGKLLFSFINEQDREVSLEKFNNIIYRGMINPFEFRINTSQGNILWLRTSSNPIVEDGTNRGIRGIAVNITDRKMAEEELEKSETEKSTILQTALDGFWILDSIGRFINVNEAASKMLGYSREEMLDKTVTEVEAKENHSRQNRHIEKILEKGYERFESKLISKDGEVKFVEISTAWNPVMERFYVFVHDITDRKIAVEEINNMKESLEKLNQRLEEIRENERASISREIHDQLGQSLTALKIDVYWLRKKVAPESEEGAKLDGMTRIIADMILDVQRISSELRPSILDDIGLVPAMEWYVSEFEKRTGIRSKLDLSDIQFTEVKKNLVLYRILQETLTNVTRHANAQNVTVKLLSTGKSIILDIADDGIGLERDKIYSYKSLGFIGIRERLKQYNGDLHIESTLNEGTRLVIEVPLI